ncbi:MAG TPA: 50S ribosomal protein L4 [Candidatus Saccharimonadales bacterium]|nr:50S ribosomal protein L4 [Candidatus Saccharimonadales bacterium]
MNAEVYTLEGSRKETVTLPPVFHSEYRVDLIQRAMLSEQSERFQPQGHFVLAGLQTTAVYVGTYSGYRRGRHMGIAIRPRQKLGGGAMGDVRRIPSSVKGKRAHPHMVEKITAERINKREYLKAMESAIAGCAKGEMIKEKHPVERELPIIVEDGIEKIQKTKDLLKALSSLGFSNDLESSHKPRILTGRSSRKRRFRKSVLIVVNDSKEISKAGRNIAGVDVISIRDLNVETLAPGTLPRPTVWSKSAITHIEKTLKER